MLPKLPLAVVTWNDAWVHAEEPITLEDVGAEHRPEIIVTIGWVLKQDEVGISIANEFYGGTYRGRSFIPAGMIVSVEPHSLSKVRKKTVSMPV